MKRLSAACEAVRADSGFRELSLLGYCLGAIFAMAHVTANRDDDVRNVIDVSVPVDVERTGIMSQVMQVLAAQTEEIVKRSNGVSAETAGAFFRMITPVRNVTRYADLFLNMWDRDYVGGAPLRRARSRGAALPPRGLRGGRTRAAPRGIPSSLPG